MMKKINTHAVFIAILFILSLFYLKNILNKDVILDNIHYINDLTFLSYNAKESLKNGELSLWTPYFYAGHPLLAVPENYMFDLNFLLIYLFRGMYLAMNLALIFYFFLAGLGMYALVYNLIENKKASFISALIYMFNGYVQSFIIHGHINIFAGYALIPFIFLFVHKSLKSKEWLLYSILAGIFFALQIFAGSLILFFYTALLVFFYMIFNLINKNFTNALIKSVFVGIVAVVIALSLASIKLLPVLEFTKMSSRAVNVSFTEFLGEPIKFNNIARILITDIGYAGLSAAIGVTGFIILIYGLLNYKKKIIAFSLTIIIFSLLFASGTFIANIMYKVPGFDKQRHIERALVLFVFAASISSAYGFISLSEKLKKYKAYAKYENFVFLAIALLIVAELIFLHELPASAKIIEPKGIQLLEYISKDTSKFRTLNLALKDVIGAAGYNYYAQKGISEVKGGGGIWVNEYTIFVSLMQQSLNSKMMGILNVKYIVSDREIDGSKLKLVNKFSVCDKCALPEAFGPYLYKNEEFLPRYYIAPSSILVVGDNEMVKQIIYNLMFQNFEPKNTVLVEGTKINDYGTDFLKKFDIIILLKDSIDENSIGRLREYSAQGGIIVPDILNEKTSISNEELNAIFNKATGSYKEIKVNEYSNNKVVLDLNGEKGWLVASERFAYFPGWEAGINSKNLDLFKANNAITSIYLEGEKGKLEFNYSPSSYRKGKLISSIALILITIYFGYSAFRKFKHGDKH